MPEMSSGAALRNLQQAHAGLKKARQLLQIVRDDPQAAPRVLKAGWEGLARSHRLLAEIPVAAASEAVMTKQLSVQRYATALLVRLRRLSRNDFSENIDSDLGEDEEF